ncbi:hypothetical protein ACLF3G_08470 [Falsiroseomonas sp. HC035]|uniref:hypothetical protein n=1 Tax=Falsiroseomonas sp. HC035 TaxID=3390999 RepID=UPI003D31BBB2
MNCTRNLSFGATPYNRFDPTDLGADNDFARLVLDELFLLYASYGAGFKQPTAEQRHTSLPGTTSTWCRTRDGGRSRCVAWIA